MGQTVDRDRKGDQVTIHEVGPRDGLQNEPNVIPTAEKIRLVDLLTDCGLRKIEVASFVDPARVPQMADGAGVLAGIRRGRASYAALVPNLRGYRAAKAAGADEVAVFVSASEGFSRANVNCSVRESLERSQAVLAAASADGMPVRGYVSCVIRCPYDGPTPPADVARVAARLIDLGCYEISLGDTVGAGTPSTVAAMLRAVTAIVPQGRLAGHFHDTGGQAMLNIETALAFGLRAFDAAVGGLGGCPFAPGAPGNVATERVVTRLEELGWTTGIDRAALHRAADYARKLRHAA